MKPFLPDPKKITERDQKYQAFIRAKPCLICSCFDCFLKKSHFHHESGLGDSGGMALKCSDFFGMPLCDAHHKIRGQMGFKPFFDYYGRDPHEIVMQYLLEYLQLKDNKVNAKRMVIDFLIEEIKK